MHYLRQETVTCAGVNTEQGLKMGAASWLWCLHGKYQGLVYTPLWQIENIMDNIDNATKSQIMNIKKNTPTC
jgi:hypothetical protein